MVNRNCLEYRGQKYDVGTVLLINTQSFGTQRVTITYCKSMGVHYRTEDGIPGQFYKYDNLDKIILDIIEPIYYQEIVYQRLSNNANSPPKWEVDIGWIWYLLIMIGGAIFQAKVLIWIVATIIFFKWKNGEFKGGD